MKHTVCGSSSINALHFILFGDLAAKVSSCCCSPGLMGDGGERLLAGHCVLWHLVMIHSRLERGSTAPCVMLFTSTYRTWCEVGTFKIKSQAHSSGKGWKLMNSRHICFIVCMIFATHTASSKHNLILLSQLFVSYRWENPSSWQQHHVSEEQTRTSKRHHVAKYTNCRWTLCTNPFFIKSSQLFIYFYCVSQPKLYFILSQHGAPWLLFWQSLPKVYESMWVLEWKWRIPCVIHSCWRKYFCFCPMLTKIFLFLRISLFSNILHL